MENFEQDGEWKKYLEKIVTKLATKSDKASDDSSNLKTKNEEAITKQFASFISTFDTNNLQVEHSTTIQIYLQELRNDTFFKLLQFSDTKDVAPLILATPTQQQKFITFMLMQLNVGIIQMLQTGQKQQFKSIKSKLIDIFKFAETQDTLKSFLPDFFDQEILQKGMATILTLKKQKPKKLIDFFSVQENAAVSLNPFTLRLITNFLVKQNSAVLTSNHTIVSTLLHQLGHLILNFQEDKSLVIKLQKAMLKLIGHVRHNLEAFRNQTKSIVQNYVVRYVTKQINFQDETSDNKVFSAVQLMFLEIHLQLGSLREDMNAKFDLKVGKFLEDSEHIAMHKRNM